MSGTQNGRSPRSVALVGPYSSGKSTLFEALMEAAGTPVKRPADPRNRPATTEVRLGHCTYLGDAWTVLDCPGSVEFAYETRCALAMVDLAVVVCEPTPARALTVAPLLKQLADDGVPHMLFINKIDTLEGSVSDTLAALQGFAGSPLVLRQVPIMDGETVSGYVDVVSERAYRYRKGQASELMQIPSEMQDDEQDALNKLVEVLADRDDALLEKVLEDVKPTTAEIYSDLRKDLAAGAVIEVLLGSAENAGGVRRLWKALRHDTPMADETAARKGIDADGPPLAQVFKTVHAGHTGKLSYARIWRGTIKDGVTLGGTRLGGIYRMPGGELAEGRRGGRGRRGRTGPAGWRADRCHGVAGRDAGTVAVPRGAAAGLLAGDRDLGSQGRCEAQRRAAEAARGRPDADDGAAAGYQRDGAARPGRDASDLDGRSAVEGLRAEGDDAQAAGRVQGDDPPRGARAWPVEEAERRARAVRRREDRHRAASARRGVRVHRQDRRRLGAAQLHSRGGGGGGGVGEEGAVRLPGGGHLGDAGGWRVPLGGQLRHGVQDRDQPGDEGRAGEGRSDPAGAGRSRDDQRAERVHAAGATAADRTARADPRVRREGGLAGLGRRRRAGAGGGTA